METFHVLVLIILVVIAYLLWDYFSANSVKGQFEGGFTSGGSIFGGDFWGGAGSSLKPRESNLHQYSYNDDSNFAKVVSNEVDGQHSVLVVYNNGKTDESGKKGKGELHIAVKAVDGVVDKERAQLDDAEKLSDEAKAIINKSMKKVKDFVDEKSHKALKKVLAFLE